MPEGHDHEIDMLGLVREEQQRWWRLAFLAEEVEWAEQHLSTDVRDARDAGWSWRRISAATGIPSETLRTRNARLEQIGCDVDVVPAGRRGIAAGQHEPAPASPRSDPREGSRGVADVPRHPARGV